MRDQYVGDVGDYVKLGLLRHLKPKQLGVIWFKTGDKDGRFTEYLCKPKKYEKFDAPLFGLLKKIVFEEEPEKKKKEEETPKGRAIRRIEIAGILGAASFFGDEVDGKERAQWFKQACEAMQGCDFVFVDPDNGLHKKEKSQKHISLREVKKLMNRNRSLLIYHHQTREQGGHKEEICYWLKQLRKKTGVNPLAIRAGKSSPRVFFLLTEKDDLKTRFKTFAQKWKPFMETKSGIRSYYDES